MSKKTYFKIIPNLGPQNSGFKKNLGHWVKNIFNKKSLRIKINLRQKNFRSN